MSDQHCATWNLISYYFATTFSALASFDVAIAKWQPLDSKKTVIRIKHGTSMVNTEEIFIIEDIYIHTDADF